MPLIHSVALAACLLLAIEAHAQEAQPPPHDMPDVIYKGIVGKALDALPIDAEKRVVLQRANAVVSGPLAGRSIAVWIGMANPLLLIAGAFWGIYSALNIKLPESKVALHANSGECSGDPQFRSAQWVIMPAIVADAIVAQ